MSEATFTAGPWRRGKCFGAVVADVPASLHFDAQNVEAYGGYLIAESIPPENIPLITAAPDMLAALQAAIARFGDEPDYCPECGGPASLDSHAEDCWIGMARAALTKATEIQPS